MIIYLNQNVLQAALERIRILFSEFPNVIVSISGGKDSTVIFNLCLTVAKELNRLPLPVLWIDQEAEWQGTVDYCTKIMTMPEVKPFWLQIPFVITNNASSYDRFSYCWNPEEHDKWIHPQHEISLKKNVYGTDRFHEIFNAFIEYEFKGRPACIIGGVRTEETPKRHISLTSAATYKWITWGKVINKKSKHFIFYPVYDWSITDVWKYIYDFKIDYNKVYDGMYRHGVSVRDMRISNLHHETAIQNLLLVQEIEPKTWNKICERIDGASAIKHLKQESFTCPKDLPYMFSSWEEYAIYLAEVIPQQEEYKKKALAKINSEKHKYSDPIISERFWRVIINTILSSDWDFTKFVNFSTIGDVLSFHQFKDKTKWKPRMLQSCKYLYPEQIQTLKDYFNGKS